MKRNAARRIIALLLSVMMVSSMAVNATAVEPRASIYWDSYQAYVYPAGRGGNPSVVQCNGNKLYGSSGCFAHFYL